MLMDRLYYLRHGDNIDQEWLQCMDEGREVSGFKPLVDEIKSMDPNDPEREIKALELYEKMNAVSVASDFKYVEPSEIGQIKLARPQKAMNALLGGTLSKEELFDKVHGAWLGRCSGCLLGQPVEGWKRSRIRGLLEETGNVPLHYYVSNDVDDKIKEKYAMNPNSSWINRIECAPIDDDLNYTIIGLKTLEKSGVNFTSNDIAETWLDSLPLFGLCTAERVAYRNLSNLIFPPMSAEYRNPYRELIGAQIRADIFGYVNPGHPESAADMAWRDAAVTHTKNGIYGEMFVAAMLAAAAVLNNTKDIVEAGLSQIPENCRLSEQINELLRWHEEGVSWEKVIENVHERYRDDVEHDWVHVIPNAVLVCAGLLYGGLDYAKSMEITLLGGLDTDCNCATLGSILGMVLGAKGLPSKWISPLNDTLKSSVMDFEKVKISDLAKRTVEIVLGKEGV